MAHPTPFDGLEAPAADGEVLCVPATPMWRERIDRSRATRRRRLVDAPDGLQLAWAAIRDDHPPRLMSGHQPELFHAGVLAKQLVAANAGESLGAVTSCLVVDHDVSEPAALRWPQHGGERLAARTASIPGGAGPLPYEHLPPVAPAAWRSWFDLLPAALRTDERPLGRFVAGFLAAADGARDVGLTYLDGWEAGMEAALGAAAMPSPPVVRTSRWVNDGAAGAWFAFVEHIIRRAGPFASAYNAALQSYRNARRIRGTQRPIANLEIDADRVETPFWVLRRGAPRERLFVDSDRGTLLTGRDAIGSDPSALDGWAVRPRALTLTMFARLFACDLFVHGLGGAKYDQITDDIIRRFFAVEPPPYVCVTATLRLDLPRHDVTAESWRAARARLRELRFNPQRFIPNGGGAPDFSALLGRRARLIGRSGELRSGSRRDRVARRQTFDQIHAVNAELGQLLGRDKAEADGLAALTGQLADNRVAMSREWFWAFHRIGALAELAAACRAA